MKKGSGITTYNIPAKVAPVHAVQITTHRENGQIIYESFPGHAGRPGHKGGSSPISGGTPLGGKLTRAKLPSSFTHPLANEHGGWLMRQAVSSYRKANKEERAWEKEQKQRKENLKKRIDWVLSKTGIKKFIGAE